MGAVAFRGEQTCGRSFGGRCCWSWRSVSWAAQASRRSRARRTDTAVDRFVAYSRPTDGGVVADPALYPRIERLPGLEYSQVATRFGMVRIDAENRLLRDNVLGAVAVAQYAPGRPIVVAGHIPRADRLDEVAVNASAATNEHLRVGDEIRFRGFGPGQGDALLRGTNAAPTGPIIKVRVAAVIRYPSDLSTAQATPDVTYTGSDTAILTPAFLRAYSHRIAELGGLILSVRFTDPAAVAPFEAKVARLSKGQAQVFTGSDDLDAAAQAKQATKVEAIALLLFGVLAAMLTLLLIAQAFARQVYLDRDEYSTLSAMGMTRPQLVGALTLARRPDQHGRRGRGGRRRDPGVATNADRAGSAGRSEPRLLRGRLRARGGCRCHRGRPHRVDGVRRVAGHTQPGRRREPWLGATTARVARRGAPQSKRFAAERHHRGNDGIRIGIRYELRSRAHRHGQRGDRSCGGRGRATFGANLARLGAEPRLQGWNWDVAVGNPHSDDVSKTAIPLLSHNPDVAAFSSIATPEANAIHVNGVTGGLFGIDAVKGPDLIPYTSGRAPRAPDEIAFGPKTLSELHVKIGDRVRVNAVDRPARCSSRGEPCSHRWS